MKGKKRKKEQAGIGGDCTTDAWWMRMKAYCLHCLHCAKTKVAKTKVEHGKQLFPHHHIVPPFGYMALSHLVRIPMPLHSFVLQLPSPSCCVWCQLDKFSFFFFPFISNLCRTMSTALSPSPPPTPVTATSKLPLP